MQAMTFQIEKVWPSRGFLWFFSSCIVSITEIT